MAESAEALRASRCRPLAAGSAALSAERVNTLLAVLDGWTLQDGHITRTFRFSNFHETMAFVNACAWISHRDDHHPELAVGYDRCSVSYLTHSVGGLSENDFICAAKLDALVRNGS